MKNEYIVINNFTEFLICIVITECRMDMSHSWVIGKLKKKHD